MTKLRRHHFVKLVLTSSAVFFAANILCAALQPGHLPNIVFIMADDLGYGEIHALNPERGKILTPAVDQLSQQGMIFTDAHTGSSVCSPTRYGLLTGRYAWRTKLQLGVLTGGAPCLISSKTLTLPEMLKEKGYATGMIGKWHLNWLPKGKTFSDGPLDHGFDYFYGYHHSRSIDEVAENKTYIGKKGAVTMLPRIEEKSIEFIEKHAVEAKAGKPFFLYLPLNSPHSPVVPAPEWRGKSGLNAHADFVMQTDHTVGQIVKAIDAAGLKDNTLIVFTADNGTSPSTSNMTELESKGHFPSWILRGSKADIWDGGHRVPFIVRWPNGGVQGGSKNDTLICHTDFIATVADIVGVKLPDDAAVDSFSYAKVLSGGKRDTEREPVVHHSVNGNFAIRNRQWKLEFCSGSGGWSNPKTGSDPVQLYDMISDIQERHNVYKEHPDIVKSLTEALTDQIAKGRSTPGTRQKNDISKIDLWKKKGKAAVDEKE
jgi:arylsulfatase A